MALGHQEWQEGDKQQGLREVRESAQQAQQEQEQVSFFPPSCLQAMSV